MTWSVLTAHSGTEFFDIPDILIFILAQSSIYKYWGGLTILMCPKQARVDPLFWTTANLTPPANDP
jgi:hypothetical protein